MDIKADGERLAGTILGTELDAEDCQVLAACMDVRTVADGNALVEEGGEDRHLYVLIEGRLRVSHTVQGGQQTQVYTMQPGECAGTAAFIEGAPRLANLVAEGQVVAYALSPAVFEALLTHHPRVVYRVMRALFRVRHENLVRLYQETEQLTNYITKMHGRY